MTQNILGTNMSTLFRGGDVFKVLALTLFSDQVPWSLQPRDSMHDYIRTETKLCRSCKRRRKTGVAQTRPSMAYLTTSATSDKARSRILTRWPSPANHKLIQRRTPLIRTLPARCTTRCCRASERDAAQSSRERSYRKSTSMRPWYSSGKYCLDSDLSNRPLTRHIAVVPQGRLLPANEFYTSPMEYYDDGSSGLLM